MSPTCTRRSGREAESYAAAADLDRALGQVPAGQRQAVVAHHVWGLSFHEIGAQLGIAGSAAKLRSSRGMRRLREVLAPSLARVPVAARRTSQ